MRLYTFPFAPNPIKLATYLLEKRIEIDTEIVDFKQGEQRSPRHLARHPGGAVPVLELDDGRYLVESLVIIEYLEELHPDPPMIGTTPEKRAFTRSMERFIELQIFLRLIKFIHATNSPLGLAPSPAVAENEQKYIPDALARLNHSIGENKFVMGDHPTIADCTLFGGLQFATTFGWQLPAEHANLNRWFESFSIRHK